MLVDIVINFGSFELDGFRDEDGDRSGCAVAIVFIGREGGYTYIPETSAFCGGVNFAHAHLVHVGLISNFNIGMRPKVVHPHRVCGSAAS